MVDACWRAEFCNMSMVHTTFTIKIFSIRLMHNFMQLSNVLVKGLIKTVPVRITFQGIFDICVRNKNNLIIMIIYYSIQSRNSAFLILIFGLSNLIISSIFNFHTFEWYIRNAKLIQSCVSTISLLKQIVRKNCKKS